MEKDPASTIPDLPPPGQARWSTVLNGVGNGAMIAGGLLYGSELAYKLTQKKPISKTYQIVSLVGTGIGAVIGGLHGITEANQIQQYREAVTGKINALEQQAAVDRDKIRELYQAVQQHAGHQGAAVG